MDLNQIISLLAPLEGKIYIVGGALRNYLLNKQTTDIDLAVKGPTKKIAQNFAKQNNGSFVILDHKRAMYRVVTENLTYDFSALVGSSIEEDLARRDFSINALALEVNDNVQNIATRLIDPFNAKDDLTAGIIRAVSNKTFQADPIRILRAVRFRAEFQFIILDNTKKLMKQAVNDLVVVAKERVREELLKVLQYPKANENIDYLEKMGVLSTLIPKVKKMKKVGQCQYHQEDVWTHSVFAIKQLEKLLANNYWSSRIEQKNIAILKFATLVHDFGKITTEEKIDGQIHFYGHQKVGAKEIKPVLKKLSFSNYEIKYISKLIRYHMRPLSLYYADNLTFKGKNRFFKAGREFVEDICLLAAADKMSTSILNNREEEIPQSLDFLQELIATKNEVKDRTKKRLITGDDLIEKFDLSPGPKIGKILAKVESKQAAGEISTRQEALNFVNEVIK